MTSARILIVPQEDSEAAFLEERLQEFGYEVCAAPGEADLALVDLELEGGIEAGERFGARIPVIYLTDGAAPDLLRRAQATAPSGYVVKPVDGRQLHLNIRTALSLRGRAGEEAEAAPDLEELQDRCQLLESMFDSISDGVIAIDKEGEYLVFNSRAREMFGSFRPELGLDERSLGYGLYMPDRQTLFPAEDLPLRRALVGESSKDVEIFVSNPHMPRGLVVSVSARPIGEEGEIRGGLIVCHDVTREKEHEAELGQAVKELEHNNEILQAVLDQVHDGVVLSTAMNQVVYMNPAAKRMFGSENLDGDPSERSRTYGIFHGDRETPVEADLLPLVRAVHGEETEGMELFFRNESNPDGIHVQASGRPLKSTGSTVRGGMAILRDVTEYKELKARLQAAGGEARAPSPEPVSDEGRAAPEAGALDPDVSAYKQAEAGFERRFGELRRHVQLIESACHTISDGIIVSDRTGGILFANATAERIFGRWIIDPEIFEWSETYGVFHADVKTPVPLDQLPLTRALAGEETGEMELFIRNQKKREGSYISARAYPVFNSDKTEVIAGVAVFQDITREREIELRLGKVSDELRDQARIMETAFNTVREGIIVVDREGRILVVNPSMERIFSMQPKEVAPKEWSETYGVYQLDQETLVPLGGIPLMRAIMGETTEEEEFFVRNENRPDGVYISASARPLRGRNQEIIGAVGIVRDISLRKGAEIRLQESNRELRRQAGLMKTIFENMDEGLAVVDREGAFLLTNPRFEGIIGMGAVDSGPESWSDVYGAFDPVDETPIPVEELPLLRAIAGEKVRDMEVLVRNPKRPEGVFVSASSQPLRDSGEEEIRAAVVIFRDITSYKRAQADLERTVGELKRQLALTEAVFGSMGEGVVVADEEGRLVIVNQAAERIAGLGALDIPFDQWSERYGFFHPDKATPVATEGVPLVRAMKGESVSETELFVHNEKKTEGVFIKCNARPLEGVRPGGAVVVFRDITGEKEAEARIEQTIGQLRDQTQLMETVFDSISDGVVVADQEGKFIIFNPAAENIVGMGMMEASPDQWTDKYGLFYSDQKTHVPTGELPLVRAMQGDSVDAMELYVRNEKRTEGVFLSVSGRPLKGRQGLGGGVAVFQDITTRKMAELELERTMQEMRNQNELMETTFNSISDGIVVANEKGSFLYVNPAAEQISGMTAEDSPPENWAEDYGTFYPDRQTPMEPEQLPLLRAIFKGESTDEVDIFMRNPARPEGVFIRVSGRPLLNEIGGIRGGVIAFRDVTEQMQAEEALARAFAQGRLEIVDTILHNIGNAINSVTTGIETVRQGVVDDQLLNRLCALADAVEAHRDDWAGYIADDPQGRKAMPFLIALARDFVAKREGLAQTVSRVRDRANHIADIVRTQRALGSPHTDRKDINLRQSLSSSVRVLQDSLGKRGIEVGLDCEDAPPEIRVQESQFHQMMVNLIKNGLEAIDDLKASGGLDDPPRIGIRAWTEGEFLHLDVTDNGIGIDLERTSSKMIFSAGYTTKESGSGLGLHSAANFAIGTGGRIEPLSEGPGKGTTMRVMLRLTSVVPPRDRNGGEDPSAATKRGN